MRGTLQLLKWEWLMAVPLDVKSLENKGNMLFKEILFIGGEKLV